VIYASPEGQRCLEPTLAFVVQPALPSGPFRRTSSGSKVVQLLLLHYRIYMGVSINGGTPIAGWFIMENPINKYDLGGAPFQETSIQ